MARGAVRAGERALAPDLARGVMLLLIVLSNTGFHLWAARHGPSGWHPVDGTTLDRAVQFSMITTLDLRVYPLFAFLFGYGMAQLYLRQTSAGTPDAAVIGLLRRRSLGLIALGFVHAALLMAGDILGAYGVTSLFLAWLFLRRSDRTVLVWCAVFTAAVVATATAPGVWAVLTDRLGDLGSAAGSPPTTVVYAAGEENLLAAAGTRLTTWAYVTAAGGLLSFSGTAVMLLGFWAARRRILEEPHRHLRLLRRTAACGLAVGWAGGLPAAFAHVGWWGVPDAAVSEGGALSLIQDGTGAAGGLGYVAVFGLLAHRLSGRRSVLVTAIGAVGRRSLSSYLTHSLIFAPLLAAWGLGLGAAMGSASMAAFAVGVWLVTVVGAYTLERRGLNGPAEVLLRRWVYGAARRPPEVTEREEQG